MSTALESVSMDAGDTELISRATAHGCTACPAGVPDNSIDCRVSIFQGGRSVSGTLAAYGVLSTRGSRPSAGNAPTCPDPLAHVSYKLPDRKGFVSKRRFLDRGTTEEEGRVIPSRKIRAARVKNRESTVWSEAIRVITHANLQRTGCSYSSWSVVYPEAGVDVCVYCSGNADTLDHLVGVVRNGIPSGFGDTQFNLVPCCSLCNTSKGQRDFKAWMIGRFGQSEDVALRIAKLEAFHSMNPSCDVFDPSEHCEMFRCLRKRLAFFFEKYDELVRRCAAQPEGWRDLVCEYDKELEKDSYGDLLQKMMDGATLGESRAHL